MAPDMHSCVIWSLPSPLSPTWGCLHGPSSPRNSPRGRESAESEPSQHPCNQGKDKWVTRVWKANKAAGSLGTFKHGLKQQNKDSWVDSEVIALVKGGGNCHRAPGRPEWSAVGPPPGGPDLPFSGPGRVPGSPQIP